MDILFRHDGWTLYVYDGNKEIGHLILDVSKDKYPTVAFIYVEPEYRRKGVAISLYREAAERLARMGGQKLYAANFQHENAQKVWTKMQTLMPERVGIENGRLFLNFA